MPIQITTEPVDFLITLVRVEGILDLDLGSKVKDVAQKLLLKGYRSLIVNLDRVPRIDPSGISSLLYVYTLVRDHNGVLTFVCRSQPVWDILQTLGLVQSHYFKIFKNEETALQNLAKLSPACQNCAVFGFPFCAVVKSLACGGEPCSRTARLPWLSKTPVKKIGCLPDSHALPSELK